jgi:hypothetical protein
MSEHRQASFVDRVYEAAVVPELWQGVLVDFARLAGAQDSVLIAALDSLSIAGLFRPRNFMNSSRRIPYDFPRTNARADFSPASMQVLFAM